MSSSETIPVRALRGCCLRLPGRERADEHGVADRRHDSSCEDFTDRLRLEAPAALTFAHARRID